MGHTTSDYDLSNPQLFLDDSWVESAHFLSRQWHQALKYPDPVLKAEHPWERGCPVTYGTVLHHEGRFKMWYATWTRHAPMRVCYADSDDGITWHKPELGVCDYEGSTANNVVLTSENGIIDNISIIDDPQDTEWPLKGLMWDARSSYRNIFAVRSKDGIHWDRSLGIALPGWGDRFNAVARRVDGKFLVFGRAVYRQDVGRVVLRTESSDLVNWTEPELVLAPDLEDSAAFQVYSTTAFPYGDLLLGGMERMHMSPDKIDTEIIWSHDAGRHWERSRTRPSFIPWGEGRRWDDTWINLPSNGPIVQGEKLWFFYSGRSGAHHSPYPINHGAIGLATLRRDGFASIRAEERPGRLLTRPMVWPGGDLQLNVDPRRDILAHPGFECGEVAVEIRDEADATVPGFGWDECEAVVTNTANLPGAAKAISWQGHSLRELAGRTIRLHFRLRDAHLYSFRAGEAASS